MSDNQLRKVQDERLITDILKNARRLKSRVVVWNMLEKSKVTREVKIKSIGEDRREIVISIKLEDVQAINELLKDKVVNFYIPEASVLFQSKLFKGLHEYAFKVRYPEMFAQVERRKNIRLMISDMLDVNVNFQVVSKIFSDKKQNFNKNAYDLSIGGLSFVITKTESEFFHVGDLIKELILKVDGLPMCIRAEVVNLIQIQPNATNKLLYAGYKLCIKFLEITDRDKCVIENFVLKNIDILDMVS